MVLSGGDPRGDGATGEGMRDAEADRARGARGAVGGAGARFDPCGFGRINHSAAFCAIHEAGAPPGGGTVLRLLPGRWIDGEFSRSTGQTMELNVRRYSPVSGFISCWA